MLMKLYLCGKFLIIHTLQIALYFCYVVNLTLHNFYTFLGYMEIFKYTSLTVRFWRLVYQ